MQGKREQFSGFNRTLDAINNVFRKFSAFHDETGRLNVDGMNIISNDGSNKLNRSRKARVSYKVQRTINASLNAATSTRAVSSNPNFVTRQKIEIRMFSVLVIRLRSLRLLRVSGIVMRLRMFLLLITFLKASHSFRNRLLVICKNAYLFATMIMTSVSSPFSCCSGIVRLNLM